MLRTWVVLVAAALAVCTVLAAEDTRVADGFFAGRSGDALVRSEHEMDVAARVSFLDATGRMRAASGAAATTPMRLASLGELLRRAMGVASGAGSATMDAPVRVAAHMWDVPAHATVFAVLGGERESDGFAWTDATSVVRVAAASQPLPYAPLAALTTAMTGAPVALHGIVGEQWVTRKGVEEHAFGGSAASECAVSGLADVLRPAGVRVLAASGRPAYAHAMGARASCAWEWLERAADDAHMPVVVVADCADSEDAGALVHADVATVLRDVFADALRVGSDGAWAFEGAPVATRVRRALLGELLAAHALVHTAPPAGERRAVMAAFTAPLEFAAASPERAQAVALARAAVAALGRVAAARGDGVVAALELPARDAAGAALTAAEREELARAVAAVPRAARVLDVRDEQLPSVRVSRKTDAQLLHTVCEGVNEALAVADSDLALACPAVASRVIDVGSGAGVYGTVDSRGTRLRAGTNVTTEEVNRYQITLWTSILLAVCGLLSVYALFGMEIPQDSLLYAKVKAN